MATLLRFASAEEAAARAQRANRTHSIPNPFSEESEPRVEPDASARHISGGRLIRWDPRTMEAQQAYIPLMLPPAPHVLAPEDEGPSFLETFLAAAARENLTFSLMEAGARMDPREGDDERIENPYAYIEENWDDELKAEFGAEIDAGLFDDVGSVGDLSRRIESLRVEKARLEAMQNGSGWAMALGVLGAAATDLTTYVPIIGAAKAGRLVYRAARVGMASAGQLAAQEIGLHQLQALRTAEESFINVGIAGVLGAGIGGFALAMKPSHVLHRLNKDNPLLRENMRAQPLGVRVPGSPEGADDIVGPASVGAAANPEARLPAPTKLRGTGFLSKAAEKAGLRWLGDKITGATPVGRAFQRTSDVARSTYLKLLDIGGILTDWDARGVAFGASAEDIKADFLNMRDQLLLFGEVRWREARKGLGKLGVKTGLSGEEFNQTARQILLDEFVQADHEALVAKYGPDGAEKIVEEATAYAERIHETNARFEQALIDIGKLKPEHAMGRQYGHAQLYNRSVVMAKQEEFENYLLDVLADTPTEDWLATKGLTPDEWENLKKLAADPEAAAQQAEAAKAAGQTPTDPVAEYTKLLREWAGDEDFVKLTKLENELAAAEFAYQHARADAISLARSLTGQRQVVNKLSISEARKHRDFLNGQLTASRAERDRLALERDTLKEAATFLRQKALDAQRGGPEFGATGLEAARLRGKAEANARLLSKATSRTERLEARLKVLDDALQKVQARKDHARMIRDVIREELAKARVKEKSFGKAMRKLKKQVARQEARTPLMQAVEEIRFNIANGMPLTHRNFNDDLIVKETGRVKARRIHYTPEQRRAGEKAGFLRTDLGAILYSQYEQLSGYIGLHEALSIGPGRQFESWKDVVKAVDDDYKRLVREGGDGVKLAAEREGVMRDLAMLRDRILGMTDPGHDPDSWTGYVSKRIREAGFIRYGAGFLLPSLTDVAAVSLRHKVLPIITRMAPDIIRNMQAWKAADASEFQRFISVTELVGDSTRMNRLLDLDENPYDQFGLGVQGTLKHTVTSAIDRGGQWLSRNTSVVSGLRAWNRFWRVGAAVSISQEIAAKVGRYDALSALDKARLASLGLGEAEARRLSKFLQKHAVKDGELIDPNFEAWGSSAEAMRAARDYRIAVNRDMHRAIFDVGVGDTPLVMSKWWGKMWLQFQSYAFAFMNKFATPAAQRISVYGDMRAVAAFGHLTWLGTIVVVGKDILNGRDPSQRFKAENLGETSVEIIDRSGMMLYLSPFVDSALKATSGWQEAAFGGSLQPTSRYARNSALDSMMGASFGLYRDISSFVGTIGSPDSSAEDVVRKGLLLMPYNTWFRLGHRFLFD